MLLRKRIPHSTSIYNGNFKDYREYVRYKNKIDSDKIIEQNKIKCRELQKDFLDGKLPKQKFIDLCSLEICAQHQDGINPWSGEIYQDQYPVYEKLDDLEIEQKKLIKKIKELENVASEGDEIDKYKTELQKIQIDIEILKTTITEIEKEAEEICKNIYTEYIDYNYDSLRKKADEESKECSLWLEKDQTPSFGKNEKQCIPEVCEKFREDTSKHPISNEKINIGDKLYNEILDLCDDYFNYLYQAPESLVLPKNFKQFPLVDKNQFSLSTLIPKYKSSPYLYTKSKYKEMSYVKGGNALYTLFSLIYLYIKHNNLCLPYLETFEIDKKFLLGLEKEESYSIYDITWSAKNVDKYKGLFEAVVNHTTFDKSKTEMLKEKIRFLKDFHSIVATQLSFLMNEDEFKDTEIKHILQKYYVIYDDKFYNILKEIQKFPTITKNTLYYNSEIISKIKSCIENGIRFICFNLSIQSELTGHSNAILYDSKTEIIERFDPLGTHPEGVWNIGEETIIINEPAMDNAIYNLFTENGLSVKGYITPIKFCPKIGPQTLEGRKRYEFEPDGYCSVWTTIYIDARLTYPDISPNILIDLMIKGLQEKQEFKKGLIGGFVSNLFFGKIPSTYDFKRFIKDYADYLSRIKYFTEKNIKKIQKDKISIKEYIELIYKNMV